MSLTHTVNFHVGSGFSKGPGSAFSKVRVRVRVRFIKYATNLFLLTLQESRWYRVCNLHRTLCSLITIFISLLTCTVHKSPRIQIGNLKASKAHSTWILMSSDRFLHDSAWFLIYAWSVSGAVSCFITYATMLPLTVKGIV